MNIGGAGTLSKSCVRVSGKSTLRFYLPQEEVMKPAEDRASGKEFDNCDEELTEEITDEAEP